MIRISPLTCLGLATLAGAIVAVGCTTFKTTLYDTDGCSPDRKCVCLKGVPTTLSVPTHVKISIIEKRYVQSATATDEKGNPVKDKDGNLIQKAALVTTGKKPDDPAVVTRHATYDLVTMHELYTVDLKRPAAGSITYNLEFDKSETLTKLETTTHNETIAQVSGLVQSIINSVGTVSSLGKGRSTTAGDGGGTTGLFELQNVVACEFFDIRDPGLSTHIREFLELYVNNCSKPCDGQLVPAACPPLSK
jgi:hypothetical protein